METKKDEWKLHSLDIRFQNGYDWEKEDFKKNDRYEGMIEFKNGHNESFSFRVLPDMADKYIALIADDISRSANRLSDDLLKSLNID